MREHASRVPLGDAPHGREAHPRAAGFRRERGLEEPPRDVLRHPRPVVGAGEAHGGRAGRERRVLGGEPDAAGRGADRLDRVHEEVRQGVADEEGIRRERVQVRLGLGLDRERFVRPEVGGDLFEEPSHGRAIEHAPLHRRGVAEPPEAADAVRQDSDLPEDSRRDVSDRAGRRRLALRLETPRRSAASRIGVSGFLMSCAMERAASTHAASLSARRKSVRSSRSRITRGARSSPGSVTIATRKKRSPEGPGMVTRSLVGRRAHGRFLEGRAEGRPPRHRRAAREACLPAAGDPRPDSRGGRFHRPGGTGGRPP